MNYEWDPTKAAANIQKHGVRFADAVVVFEDEHAVTIEDIEASGEQRFLYDRHGCSSGYSGSCVCLPI